MTTASQVPETADRQRWMGVLAKAARAELDTALQALDAEPAHEYVRPPEFGSALLRGRIGGDGAAFNFGEATLTRCAVRLAGDGPLGFGYVLGRDKRHAEIAAIFDALLQRGDARAKAQVELLARSQSRRAGREAAAAATSRVEFFTLVRE